MGIIESKAEHNCIAHISSIEFVTQVYAGIVTVEL